MNAQPTKIRLDPERSLLEITWADAHVTRVAGNVLRWQCPCAVCRGHAPGEVEPPSFASVADVRVTGAAPVGSYGLRFTFTDGHDTGIYMWEVLRALQTEAPSGDD